MTKKEEYEEIYSQYEHLKDEYVKELEEQNNLFKSILNFLLSKTTRGGWIYMTIKRMISDATGKSIDEVLNE